MSKEGIGCPGEPDMKDLARIRMNICKRCPLYKNKYFLFPVCNEKLYLNPITNDVSTTPKEGYRRGCGCNLEYRTLNPTQHCINGKW